MKTPKRAKDTDDIKYFTIQETLNFLRALDMEYEQPVKGRKRKDSTGKEYDVAPYVVKKTIPLQFKVLYYITIYSGLRRGEVLSLTWDDIDFENNCIDINKSTAYVNKKTYIKGTKTKSSERIIDLPQNVMKLISQYKKEYFQKQLQLGSHWATDENGKRFNFLFIQENGKQMNLSTPRQRFISIIEDYNKTVSKEEDKLPLISFHNLRHTNATLLISQGINVSTVSARLGHAQTSTTMDIYAHALKEVEKTASVALENLLSKQA